MENVLIITVTPEANAATHKMLHNAGYNYMWDKLSGRTSPYILVRDSESVFFCSEFNGKQNKVYLHSELTPEIVATFPGAKEPPPSGPFTFEGVEYEIDGDEKREPVFGDIFMYMCGELSKYTITDYVETDDKRWIFRPITSPAIQEARKQLDIAKTAVENAEQKLNELEGNK